MKLTHTGIYHSGQSLSTSFQAHYSTYEQGAISLDLSCVVDTEKATSHDSTQHRKLSINWVYSIYYHGINVFVFDTEERFDITEMETVPDVAEVRSLMSATAVHFVTVFNERQQEYSFLQKMNPIDIGEWEKNVQPVIDILNPLVREKLH